MDVLILEMYTPPVYQSHLVINGAERPEQKI